MQKISTDYRVLAILMGGENLLDIIDPEGLFSNGRVDTLRYNRDKTDKWSLAVSFESRNIVEIRGMFDSEQLSSIVSVSHRVGKDIINIPVEPTSSLSEALGDLSRLPVSLKQDMGQFRPRKTDSGNQAIHGRKYYDLVREAAFWNVEGGDSRTVPEEAFPYLSIDFAYSDNSPWSAAVSLREPIEDGFIEISFNNAVFGLSEKHVFLNRNLGQGHSIRCECLFTQDNRKIPSLKLAFDLSRDLVLKPTPAKTMPESPVEQAKQLARKVLIRKKKFTNG